MAVFIRFAMFLIILGATGCGTVVTPTTESTPVAFNLVDSADAPTSTFTDPALREGESNYLLYCAHCHGYEGGGQAIDVPGNTARLGMKLVPALDSTGDAWGYADLLLLEVIKNGIQNPLDQYPMLGWKAVMTDEQINNLLAYIKLWWRDEQRTHQAEVSANLIAARQESGLDAIDATAEATSDAAP
jgi:mono/diheme cytochrome c family protein